MAVLISALIGWVLSPFVSLLTARPPLLKGAEPLSLQFRCDACRAPIATKDAVPVLSFVWLRGKCRACHQSIAWDGAAELGSVVISAFIAWRVGWHSDLPAYLLLGLVTVIVVLVDARIHRIAYRLVQPAAIASFVLLAVATFVDHEWSQLGRAVLGAIAATVFIWILHFINPAGMGDGDVRLMWLLGLFMGWNGWIFVFMGLFYGFMLGSLAGIFFMLTKKAGRKSQIAFGPYLCAGALLVVLFPSTTTLL